MFVKGMMNLRKLQICNLLFILNHIPMHRWEGNVKMNLRNRILSHGPDLSG
jgi:hypothetical protein